MNNKGNDKILWKKKSLDMFLISISYKLHKFS